MPKNIVVLSDGTGQEGGKGYNTNIYNIYDAAEDRTFEQVLFYDAGAGTGWRKVTGNAFGRGFTENMRQAYLFIFEQYQMGDHIFMLGFSRGAATVRSLASFVNEFGILPRSRPRLIDDAFKLYKRRSRPSYEKRRDDFLAGNGTTRVPIEFLGVYDTVAALGFPLPGVAAVIDKVPGFRHKFHNFDLSSNVRRAYQALAIDDERKTFHPILWNPLPPDVTDRQIRQVWFAGMHTDVGGGYASGKALANIPYSWLLQQAVSCGLRLKGDTQPDRVRPNEEDPGDYMHDSRGKRSAKVFRRAQRAWPSGRADKPVIHESVLHRRGVETITPLAFQDPIPPRRVEVKAGQQVEKPYDPWILKAANGSGYLDSTEFEVEPWIKLDDFLVTRAGRSHQA